MLPSKHEQVETLVAGLFRPVADSASCFLTGAQLPPGSQKGSGVFIFHFLLGWKQPLACRMPKDSGHGPGDLPSNVRVMPRRNRVRSVPDWRVPSLYWTEAVPAIDAGQNTTCPQAGLTQRLILTEAPSWCDINLVAHKKTERPLHPTTGDGVQVNGVVV